jgi:hypothetical protein
MLAQGCVRNHGNRWTWTPNFLVRPLTAIAVTRREDEAETDHFATTTDRRFREQPESLLAGGGELC